MSGTSLRVEGLSVSYGALLALNDVTWDVRGGEILGIIGPNGAGKSSCYDAVTHLIPRQGRVTLCGEDVTTMPPHRLAERGLKRAFQQNAFFHDLTVLENMVCVLQDQYGTGLLASTLFPLRQARRRAAAVEDAMQRLRSIRSSGRLSRAEANQRALRHSTHAIHRFGLWR